MYVGMKGQLLKPKNPLYYYYQIMESENLQQQDLNMNPNALQSIITGVNDYILDNSRTQIWPKVFQIIHPYIPKDSRLSTDSQKLINFYLQKLSQSDHPLRPFFARNKEIICLIYDLVLPNKDETMDEVIATGLADERVLSKIANNSKNLKQGNYEGIFVGKCVEIVASCFCLFLENFKKYEGNYPLNSRRQIWSTLRRKRDWFMNEEKMMEQIFMKPICLLEGFLDNIKPMIQNYINMENLLQVTQTDFKDKEGLLIGYDKVDRALISKKVKLDSIFDSSIVGRQAIQNKLKTIAIKSQNLSEQTADQNNDTWSLVTCISQYQQKLHCVFQKLPRFIRPRSNGDILSFCRFQLFPTYKYQIIKSGYIEGPILTDCSKIFFNAGRVPFQIISIPNSSQIDPNLTAGELWTKIDAMGIPYGKVQVRTKNIAIVPANHNYIISYQSKQSTNLPYAQILFWQVLPKNECQVLQCIKSMETKRKKDPKYLYIQLSQIILDYLSHEYLIIEKGQFLDKLVAFVGNSLLQQQVIFFQLSKNLHPTFQKLHISQRYCQNCLQQILNYYCIDSQRVVCVACGKEILVKKQQREGEKKEDMQFVKKFQLKLMHHPKVIRYPLSLVKLLRKDNLAPSLDFHNKYEQQVCCADFIGAIQNQGCKGSIDNDGEQLKTHVLSNYSCDDNELRRREKDLKIVIADEIIKELALSQPLSQEEKEQSMKRIKQFIKQVYDKEKLKKQICQHYDQKNLVMPVLFQLQLNK